MTAQEIVDFIRGIIISPITGYITDAEIIMWINDGLREFYKQKGLQDVWSWNVSQGEDEIPFDTRILRIAKLLFDNGTTETLIDNDEFEIFNNVIYLATPISVNGKLWAWGYRIPTAVTSVEDTVDISPSWEAAIKNYVLGIAYLKDENFNMSQYQLALFIKSQKEYFAQSRQINIRKKIIIEKGI